MNSPLCVWLSEIEEALRGMISGAINYIFREFPEKVCRMLFETVGPVAIRLLRVALVFGVWCALVFGPVVMASKLGLSFWGYMTALTWLGLASIGSAWGRRHIKKRRAAREADKDASEPDSVGEQSAYDGSASNNGGPAPTRLDWESIKDCIAKS